MSAGELKPQCCFALAHYKKQNVNMSLKTMQRQAAYNPNLGSILCSVYKVAIGQRATSSVETVFEFLIDTAMQPSCRSGG